MADIQNKSLTISGLDDLEDGLRRLADYAEKSVIKDALKAGATLVANTARGLAPDKTGKLKRAIKVRAGRSRKGNFSFLAACGKRWFQGDQFYGAFQEFGWKSGKRKSANRKQIPGEHFMEYAFDEQAEAAKSMIVSTIRDGIERELGK